MLLGEQGRLHANLHTVAGIQSHDGHELDGVAHVAGEGEVDGGNVFDAFDKNIRGADPASIAEPGEHERLVPGVPTVHIQRGIGLRITRCLSFQQRFRIGKPCRRHARKNIVSGAVDDAVDRLDLIANERLAHRLDDGNASGHCRFKIERHIFRLGQFHQLHPPLCQQGLVARDDGLARKNRPLDEFISIRGAADEFDNDRQRGIGNEFAPIGGDESQGHVEFAGLGGVAHGDSTHFNFGAHPCGQQVSVLQQIFVHTRTDIAEACETDLNWGNCAHGNSRMEGGRTMEAVGKVANCLAGFPAGHELH